MALSVFRVIGIFLGGPFIFERKIYVKATPKGWVLRVLKALSSTEKGG